jgi:hydrogenase/urease accessory protein HupE
VSHRGAAAAVAFACVLLGATAAHAHDPFEITADAHVSGDRLTVHTTMSLLTAARICFAGEGTRKTIEVPELAALWPALDDCARRFFRVSSGGGTPLAVIEARVDVTRENDLDMRVAFPRPRATPLVFEAAYLQRLSTRAMAGVVLTATGARSFLGQKVLRPDDAVFEIPITADAETPGTPPVPGFRRYALLGVEHILTGYDHLLFLLGLLLVCRRARTVAVVVTCFTAAHSVTLALAALHVVTLSGRVVEPLIAASIVFVGVENVVRGSEPDQPWPNGWLLTRWGLAFAFGLIHGLGFAGALEDIGLGRDGAPIIAPLVAFNLGIELGQLAIALPLFAVLWKLRALPAFARTGVKLASLLVAAVGLVWLVQRLIA